MLKDIINKLTKDSIFQIQEKGENEITLYMDEMAVATFKGIEDVISPELNNGRIFMLKNFQKNHLGRFLILYNNGSFLLIDWTFNFPYDEYFENIDELLARMKRD